MTPDVARHTDGSEKEPRLAERAPTTNIRSCAGTPGGFLLFFDDLVPRHPGRGARLVDFFPALELVIHGGVNFAPYRRRFSEWLDGSRAELREGYAASEGVVAAADPDEGDGLRLLLWLGNFHEFPPGPGNAHPGPHL